jgi:pimeloyl-ACP methyl ester carboxylesterase
VARKNLIADESSSDPLFVYERTEIPFKNRMLDEEETPQYRVRYIRFPSIGDNGQPDELVRGKYYESKLPGPKPMVIVLPIWGRHVYPSTKITAYLKRHSEGGVNVFYLEGGEDLFDWQALGSAPTEEAYLDLWEDGAQRELVTMTDIRRVIDWAEERAELDSNRIGLVGFSHGAMVAAAVATQEPRLAATVLVMGGALAHEVIARCPLARSEPARNRAAEGFGWSTEDLERRLEPILAPLDPASYPGRVDPERVLIVEAARDECMTEAGRKALWEAMDRPERIRLDYRHKQAFLTMTPLRVNWLRQRIWSFFQQTLMEPS